jgi:hypothetical protein
MAFDPAKAALYNKLVKQGLSDAAASAQAGIGDNDYNYEIDEIGTPATNPNWGTIQAAGADLAKRRGPLPPKPTAEELADAAEAEADLNPPPGSKNITSSSYVTTSTETVSGGGSKTITVGPKLSTAESQALQPAIDAKQTEIDAFYKDNPSPFARKKLGLPPLTPEENQARIAKGAELQDQRTALVNGQTDLKESTPPTTTIVPNTTTTTQTTTYGTSSTNTAVNPDQDAKLSQNNETYLQSTTTPANATSAKNTTVQNYSDNSLGVSPDPNGNGGFVNANGDPVNADGTVIPPATITPAPFAGQTDEFGGVDNAVAARRAENLAANNGGEGDGTGVVPPPEDTGENVFDPANVPPNSDPYEQARYDAQLASDQEPPSLTAADVEPMSDEELMALEKAQAYNRGELSKADAIDGAAVAAQAAQQAAMEQMARDQATYQARFKQPANGDWRVRLSISPNAKYLYLAEYPGILAPLAVTEGVVFPYTPQITTAYSANYEQYDLTHSNYRGTFYKSSKVGDISIRGVFTAQDTREAEYLLAVIHFFRSVTKMFYGQDAERGTPPPLCYLNGFGQYQFSNHPCVVSMFNYTLPNEVDYIRANNPNNFGVSLDNRSNPVAAAPLAGGLAGWNRLKNAISGGLPKGAVYGGGGLYGDAAVGTGQTTASVNNTTPASYVPTKMEIDITLIPMQTRSQVSKQFSLKGFARGDLIRGGFW